MLTNNIATVNLRIFSREIVERILYFQSARLIHTCIHIAPALRHVTSILPTVKSEIWSSKIRTITVAYSSRGNGTEVDEIGKMAAVGRSVGAQPTVKMTDAIVNFFFFKQKTAYEI